MLATLVTGTILLYSSGKTFNETGKLDSVTSRFQDTLELIETREYSADASTAYRVAEIQNVFGMLIDKFPYSLPFIIGAAIGLVYSIEEFINCNWSKDNVDIIFSELIKLTLGLIPNQTSTSLII